jgi:acyl carrier protein
MTTVTTSPRTAEVLEMVLDALGLDDVEPAEVDLEAPIFASKDPEGRGLGLDSVDALEIIVALRKTYGIRMADEDRVNLRSIQTIAAYVDRCVQTP